MLLSGPEDGTTEWSRGGEGLLVDLCVTCNPVCCILKWLTLVFTLPTAVANLRSISHPAQQSWIYKETDVGSLSAFPGPHS